MNKYKKYEQVKLAEMQQELSRIEAREELPEFEACGEVYE